MNGLMDAYFTTCFEGKFCSFASVLKLGVICILKHVGEQRHCYSLQTESLILDMFIQKLCLSAFWIPGVESSIQDFKIPPPFLFPPPLDLLSAAMNILVLLAEFSYQDYVKFWLLSWTL